MVKQVTVKMNNAGVQEILKSPGVQSLLMSQAERVARAAGPGYVARAGTAGKTRSRAWAVADTPDAMRDNAKNATLLRTLGVGR